MARIVFTFDQPTLEQLEELAKVTGAESMAEAARRAVRFTLKIQQQVAMTGKFDPEFIEQQYRELLSHKTVV